ncbi:MAG: cupredoxin domain-containing protein [Gaiellaceae bacterium]
MRKAVLFAATITMVVGVASAEAASSATTVKVSLKEFKVLPSTKTVKAGKVTFSVKNVGKVDHQLVVVKTNVAPGKLAVKNGKASEKGKVGGVAELKPGKSGKVTLKLAKGKYVLLCNVTAHYQAGQYTGFTVK